MFCSNCGSKNPEGAKFCKDCGERLDTSDVKDNKDYGSYVEKAEPKTSSSTNFQGIGRRSIAACVIFSIITCGIYGLYWIYKMNQEINIISNHEDDTSGGLVILFGIITCGIYYVYWAYKMGDKLKEYYTKNKSNEGEDLPVLFLILMIANYIACGICTIVCYCLMQDRINKIVTK